MKSAPSLEEIEATVVQIELSYASSPHFAAYIALREQFEADLAERRDLALAKSAALMLIKQIGNDT